MKFDTKIENAVNAKDVRFYLNGVYLDSENNRAMATNGNILAVIPFESEYSGIVPLDAVKLSQKKDHGIVPGADGVTVTNCNSDTAYKYVDGTFPDCDRVTKPRTGRYLALNAELLAKLQKALCSTDSKTQGIKLYIPENDGDGMRVEPAIDNGAYGVIMPMRQ